LETTIFSLSDQTLLSKAGSQLQAAILSLYASLEKLLVFVSFRMI